MSSLFDKPTPNRLWHYVSIVSLFGLSLVLPTLIIWGSVVSALSGKPLGNTDSEKKVYQGALKDGVLWFSVIRGRGTLSTPGSFDCRIKRLDLTTGEEQETGLVVVDNRIYPIRINDEIYAVSDNLDRINGSSLEKIASMPKSSTSFNSLPFSYENQLTTITETDDGGFRLVHLINDHWANGRRILLPGLGRTWYHDSQRNRKSLLPLTSFEPPTTVRTRMIVRVAPHQQAVHVFQFDFQQFASYRSGLEFVDETTEEASALAPENALREVSGWEPIDSENNPASSIVWAVCDRQGPLCCDYAGHPSVFRRINDGHWQAINGLIDQKIAGAVILADPAEKETYLVQEDQRWNTASIYRLVDTTIQPAHLTLNGSVPSYLARWKRLILGVFFALLTHHSVLTCGLSGHRYENQSSVYQYGIQQAKLASVWQRFLAFVADLLFGSVLFMLFAYFLLPTSIFGDQPITAKNLCEFLFQYERALQLKIDRGSLFTTQTILDSFQYIFQELQVRREYILLVIVLVLVLWFVKVGCERLCGFTPGKWLMGIRTLRSTLRPAGVPQLLVRDLLFCLDIPFFVTSIPAVFSMFWSLNGQRLGDRVADTIVIQNNSVIRNNSVHDEKPATRIQTDVLRSDEALTSRSC